MHACAQHAASAHITLDAYNNHQNKCTLDPPTRLQLPAAARIVAAAAPFSFKKKHGQPINRKQWCSHTHTTQQQMHVPDDLVPESPAAETQHDHCCTDEL
jgi:hypothetical protein